LAKIVNTALVEGKGWLVGGQLTIADVIVSISLVESF
jgi:glutathione S-transferase